MDGDTLQQHARDRVAELPAAELQYPFGPDWEVFKVRGKVFMLMTEVTGDPIVIVKTHPEDGKTLREQHQDITPGWHMNKQHWNTVTLSESLDAELWQGWIEHSYLRVVAGLPKAKRPLAPTLSAKAG